MAYNLRRNPEKLNPSAPGSWAPTNPAGKKVKFKENGTFQSSENFLQSSDRFAIEDSNIVVFTTAGTPGGSVK